MLAGVRDQGSGGEHLPLMCSAWNAPGYQEFERLLPILRLTARPLYRAVVGVYVYPRFVRRAVCRSVAASGRGTSSVSSTSTATARQPRSSLA